VLPLSRENELKKTGALGENENHWLPHFSKKSEIRRIILEIRNLKMIPFYLIRRNYCFDFATIISEGG
jgi:hypothetical protein